MAVDQIDINKGVEVLKKNGARKVWLFGSALDSPSLARDIDFACEGIAAGRFFDVIGELLDTLDKPVDLVDLTIDNSRTRFIRHRGRLLYEYR